jgi:hypothetical protein
MSGADSCLKLDFTVRGAVGDNIANSILLNKCGAYGFFQRMRVFHGGSLLSDIDNYAALMDMLIPIQQSSDSIVHKYRILAGTNYGGGASVNTSPLTAGTELTNSYCLPLMSILSLTQNYVPLFAMSGSALRIELQVSGSINQMCKSFVQVVNPVNKSVLSRLELVCNMIELSDTGMSIIKQSIGNGANDTNVSVPIPAKFNSLNSLFFAFRQYWSGQPKYQALESCKFGLQEYFLRIGSQTMPVKPSNSVPESYSEVLRSFGTVYTQIKFKVAMPDNTNQ